MARSFILGVFDSTVPGRSAYIADRGSSNGGLADGAAFRFRDPGDISDDGITAIFAAIQGARVEPGNRSICPPDTELTMRRIQFVRQDGNSITLPFPQRDNLIQSANNVISAIAVGSPNNKVVCAHLLGEETGELIDILRTNTAAPEQGEPSTAVGKQPVYSGKYAYAYDGPELADQKTLSVSYKVDSESETAPPSVLGAVWGTCAGEPQPSNPCPTVGNLKHRRYIGTFRVIDPNGIVVPPLAPPSMYQRTELPVSDRTEEQILGCGIGMANLPSIVCLQYRGESRRNFQRLLNLNPQ